MEQRLTVEAISQKEFTISNNGYNSREVDNFLDDICDEMDRLNEEIKQLKQQNAVVRTAPVAQPAPAPVVRTAMDDRTKDRLVEMLELAARLKDETISKAEEEADAIRTRATAEASERLKGLDEEKTRLEGQVEEMKKNAADFREKFEALLQAQKEMLDKAEL